MKTLRRRGPDRTILLGFLIPFAGMLLVMAVRGVCPFGTKRAFLYSDAYHQYYPFFVQLRRVLRSGGSLLYSWELGMGTDFLGLISYYLASPLNLLSVLVPESLLLPYFCMLLPIKLGLAGMFFTIFLKRLYGRQDLSPALFGAMYALCAWALGYQWNIMWLDTFALLPLVMLGMVSLLSEQRFLLYCITLALSVAANYYIGLFVCYFVFLTFFCYEICRWRGWKRFFADLLRMGVFSLLALGLSAVITVSGTASLLSTQSSVNQFPTGFRLNIAKSYDLAGLLDGMRQVAGNLGGGISPSFKEGLPNVYSGVGTLLLAFMFLLSRRISVREKLCSVFLLIFFMLSFLIRQLDYVWHGFHFTNMIPYRFSFLVSFVLLYMAYRAWLERQSFTCVQVFASFVLTAAVLACSNDLLSTETLDAFGRTWEIPVYLIYNAGFLTVFSGILFLHSSRLGLRKSEEDTIALCRQRLRRRKQRWTAVFCVILAGEISGMLINFACWFPTTGLTGYPRGGEDTASMLRVMQEREADREFSRAEMTHSQTLNDDALNGYAGITAFTSSANVHITEFLQSLGYGAKNTYNRYCYEESSPVADLFLNIKYMLDREQNDRESSAYRKLLSFGSATLYENRWYLPLGFMTDSALAGLSFQGSGDSFDFQNRLFAAATGLTQDVWHQVPMTECQVTGSGVEVSDIRASGFCSYSAPESAANVIYSFRADRDGFACIRVDFPKRNDLYISVNGTELYHETISLPQMMAVKDVKEGDFVDIRIVCKAGEAGTLNVSLAIMDMPVFEEGYTRLSSSTMTITDFSDTRVTGVVDCRESGLLYTSIPQNGSWYVFVDGEPVEPVLVGECMISVFLTEGEHRVEFRYMNRAFILGVSITLGCTAALIALYLLDGWLREKRARRPAPGSPAAGLPEANAEELPQPTKEEKYDT